MKAHFDHEKLDIYQESIAFCGWIGELVPQTSARAAVKHQLDTGSTSLPLNIAEGNGKFSKSLAVQHWNAPRVLMCLQRESSSIWNVLSRARKSLCEL
jgi:hypothetical protein